MNILKRDPAFWTGLVAVIVQFFVAWGVDLTEGQQAAVNAAAAALVGVIVAWSVARDQVVALAAGLLTAVLQLFVAFGYEISQEKIATAGALLTALLAAYLRTQVTARIDPQGNHVPKETVTK